MDLLPSSSVVDPAFSQLAMERGVAGKVKGGGEELATHTFVTPQLTTLVVENRVSAMKQMPGVHIIHLTYRVPKKYMCN